MRWSEAVCWGQGRYSRRKGGIYILFPTRCVVAHLLMNSNLCYLICRRPVLQHSEEQVHPAGDQDLADKDPVSTAEIGVVQQHLHCPCATAT